MDGSGIAGYEPGEVVDAVLSEIDQLRASVATLTAQRNDRNFHLAAATAEVIHLRAQVATLTAEKHRSASESNQDAFKRGQESLAGEVVRLQGVVATLTDQRDTAQAATAAMAQKCERLMACVEHYADECQWIPLADHPWRYMYTHEGGGWAVAREALNEKS